MLEKIFIFVGVDLVVRPIAFMDRKIIEFYTRAELVNDTCIYTAMLVLSSMKDFLKEDYLKKRHLRTVFKTIYACETYKYLVYEKRGLNINGTM